MEAAREAGLEEVRLSSLLSSQKYKNSVWVSYTEDAIDAEVVDDDSYEQQKHGQHSEKNYRNIQDHEGARENLFRTTFEKSFIFGARADLLIKHGAEPVR